MRKFNAYATPLYCRTIVDEGERRLKTVKRQCYINSIQ